MGDYAKRLELIRNWMIVRRLDAFIVPSGDPHQSEYVADYWKTRKWLTGFSGSAGTAVITNTQAQIWTDSRYFLQAEGELEDKPFQLMKDESTLRSGIFEWLKKHLPQGSTVGMDGQLVSETQARKYIQGFLTHGIEFRLVDDPFLETWENRPSLPQRTVFQVSASVQEKSRREKIEDIRSNLVSNSADILLVTDLDEVCWALNLRGSDIECNTSTISYLTISAKSVNLFINREKVSPDLEKTLKEDGVNLHTYRFIRKYIADQSNVLQWLVDPAKCNASLFALLPQDSVLEQTSQIYLTKAIKTQVEIQSIRQTMILDGVALSKAFMWLENTLTNSSVREDEFASKIAECRAQQLGYFSESFPAIVGYQQNGAIVHYRPQKGRSSSIKQHGMLLVDSGGHYQTGTTDITRTIALSTPTQEQKAHYTAVLKGHIALATIVFPKGVKGYHLDILARQHLWSSGLNYGHGTGHGVGFFSNVHEGPYGISPGVSGDRNRPLKPGVLLTNEPGFYLEGAYGIRIENVMLTIEHSTTKHGKFLSFETLSWFPIDLTCVDFRKLTRDEIIWINGYHTQVRENLIPHLSKRIEKFWMLDKTKPISSLK